MQRLYTFDVSLRGLPLRPKQSPLRGIASPAKLHRVRNDTTITKTFLPRILLSGCIFTFLAAGCTKAPPPVKNFPEANEKFLQLCKDEYHLNVITKRLDHTLWIYYSTTQSFLDYRATDQGPQSSNKAKEKFSVQFADGRFKNGTFYLEYDIRKATLYAVDPGYKSAYSEEFQKTQTHLLTAVYRAYADLDKDLEPKPLEFVVMVIADIERGVEMKSVFNLEDLKMVQTGALPPEEFLQRDVSQLQGEKSIIGDTDGRHLELEDIAWPDFLTQQILNRLRFQYQHSDFPPSEDTEKEIATIAAVTIKAYDFKDFSALELNNLAKGKTVFLGKVQLETFTK